jgi:hypothetical protein
VSRFHFSDILFVESVWDVFFKSVLFLMLKGQSAKCDEGPIRIIAENFRHFEEGGHSSCIKKFPCFLVY